jgi:GNAT superfamily N-acetyltransferase
VGKVTGVIADSVRLALPAEASVIAAIQRNCWSQTLPPATAEQALASVSVEEMAASWEEAVTRPPLAQLRVLVAVGEDGVAGFAAIGPSDDPDADASEDAMVAEFCINPESQRMGHGSRLLNACVDTLRADGFSRATWWVRSDDDVLRRFLTDAGWAADGAHSEVAMDEAGPRVKLVRLHTGIA